MNKTSLNKYLSTCLISLFFSTQVFGNIRISGETQVDLSEVPGTIEVYDPLAEVVVGTVPNNSPKNARITIHDDYDIIHYVGHETGLKLRVRVLDGKTLITDRPCEFKSGSEEIPLGKDTGQLFAVRLSFKFYPLDLGKKGVRCTFIGAKYGMTQYAKTAGAVGTPLAPEGTFKNDPQLLSEVKALLGLNQNFLRTSESQFLGAYKLAPIEEDEIDDKLVYLIAGYLRLAKAKYKDQPRLKSQSDFEQLFALFVHQGLMRSTDVKSYIDYFSSF